MTAECRQVTECDFQPRRPDRIGRISRCSQGSEYGTIKAVRLAFERIIHDFRKGIETAGADKEGCQGDEFTSTDPIRQSG